MNEDTFLLQLPIEESESSHVSQHHEQSDEMQRTKCIHLNKETALEICDPPVIPLHSCLLQT